MKATDVDLAELALSRGLISKDCHHRSLLEADRYQALGLDKSVEEILVEEGSLTSHQVRSLRNELGFTLKRPRIGDYEVVRRVGLGGMGTVFEARHVRLKQRIALKVLFPRLAHEPGRAERFLFEARMLARLNHPHLVHAVDAGQDGEYYYLAMEFIEGENLLQVLQREKALKPLRALEIVRAVCEALGALEEKGLVHRDVKPANILIGPEGVVKLADLGLLKSVDEPVGLAERFICGTPHYIPPEQIERRDDIDIRSDFYSLAATWYHLVVGRPPFVGRNTREILEAHLALPPPPPSRLRRDVPPAVERVLLGWLSKDREERPRSARAALEEIEKLALSLKPRGAFRGLGGRLLRTLKAHPLASSFFLMGGLALAALFLFLSPGRERGSAMAPPPPLLAREEAAPGPKAEPVFPAGPSATASASLPPASTLPTELSTQKPREKEARERPLEAPSSEPSLEPVLAFLYRKKERLEEAMLPYRKELEEARRRFEPLERLGKSFHAAFVALEPERHPPAGIVLSYRFLDEAELGDFRFLPGAWKVAGGALLGSAADPTGETIDSLAFFVPPLEIEGTLPREASFIVGLGNLRAALGRGDDAFVWQQVEKEEVPVLKAPATPAGAFAVRFLRDGVEIMLQERTRSVKTPVPEKGRLVLRIASGRFVSSLRLRGTLEPTWASERLRLLEK